jgi:long-chain fatty acid transport protein
MWSMRIKLRRRHYVFLAVLCLILSFKKNSEAGALIHGGKAAGMAAAFVAIADDPSAIVHNPAGLTTLRGTNIYGGVTAVMGSTKLKNPAGETEESDFQVFFPPHLYISSDLKQKKIAVGFGIYSPFGIGGREWSDEGLTRYVSTKNLIGTLAANPVLAYRPFPWLSVAAGFFYLYSSTESARMIDQSALGAEDGRFSLEGDGGGYGYNFGVLLFPGRRFSFGLAYRSGAEVDQDVDVHITNLAPFLQPFTGGSAFRTDAKTSLDFPPVLNFGMAYRPTKSLTFGLEFEWTGWSSFDKMDVDLREEIPQAGVSDFSVDFGYKDTWIVKMGVELAIKDNYYLRGGYAYVNSPAPVYTLNPGNPDADQHSFSIGFGYRKRDLVLDFFYVADLFKERTTDNPILPGTYRGLAHFAGLSVGYHF